MDSTGHLQLEWVRCTHVACMACMALVIFEYLLQLSATSAFLMPDQGQNFLGWSYAFTTLEQLRYPIPFALSLSGICSRRILAEYTSPQDNQRITTSRVPTTLIIRRACGLSMNSLGLGASRGKLSHIP
ncbi:hypothetical protein Hypma_011022 [Hypsizygus marmoreus]|uniref:Uncharacterized protein n=1 Tax=Hypsizygus marmoreus TaxID=39966 RepID=A0A369JL89_HYPMA|nr:hypothetical protein Hypma_011022 [Hypsizygus marmoreus]